MTEEEIAVWIATMKEAEEPAEDLRLALHLVAVLYHEAYPGIIRPHLSLDEWNIVNRALQGEV